MQIPNLLTQTYWTQLQEWSQQSLFLQIFHRLLSWMLQFENHWATVASEALSMLHDFLRNKEVMNKLRVVKKKKKKTTTPKAFLIKVNMEQ